MLYLFTFSCVGNSRKDGHAHSQVEQQDADLAVAVLQVQQAELLVRHPTTQI